MKNTALLIFVFVSFFVLGQAPVHSAPKNPTTAAAAKEQKVAFNTKSLKYHGLSCKWAKKCTTNCVVIPLSEAVKRGGVACKVCGGR